MNLPYHLKTKNFVKIPFVLSFVLMTLSTLLAVYFQDAENARIQHEIITEVQAKPIETDELQRVLQKWIEHTNRDKTVA